MSQQQPAGAGSPAPGSSKRSQRKLDEETERLLTQLLLQRGAALQGRADEEGVLAFCRQPVVRERPNERFLQNTLRSVHASNKRAIEAAMWEQRQLQKEREEQEAAAGVGKLLQHDRQGRRRSTPTHSRERGSANERNDGRDYHHRHRRNGNVPVHGSPVRGSRDDGLTEGRAIHRSATTSRAVGSMQGKGRAEGTPIHSRHHSLHARHGQEGGNGGVRISEELDDDRWQPSSDSDVGCSGGAHDWHGRSRHGSGSVSQGSTPARQNMSPYQDGMGDASISDASNSSSRSGGSISSTSGSGRSRSLGTPVANAGKGRARSMDGADSGEREGGGEGEEEQGWVMRDDELQELLGRHLAKGRGGVGSRVEETGPYLPAGAPSTSALEGVSRGPVLPPWLAAARSGSPSPGPGMLLQDPAAAARQLLARDRELAKLLRKVAKRKLEEEDEEAGKGQRAKKKRRRSDGKHKSKKKSKKSKEKSSKKGRKSRSRDR